MIAAYSAAPNAVLLPPAKARAIAARPLSGAYAVCSRTLRMVVLFLHPFRVPGAIRQLPAGVYRVTTVQDEWHGASFIAHCTVATFLQLPALDGPEGDIMHFAISADDLEACVVADRGARQRVKRLTRR